LRRLGCRVPSALVPKQQQIVPLQSSKNKEREKMTSSFSTQVTVSALLLAASVVIFSTAGPSKSTWSWSCAGYQVVPGSNYDFAYVNFTINQTYDPLYCKTNSHPNATLPIFRDLLTGEFLGKIKPWFWVGLYRLNGTYANNTGFYWIDGVPATERLPNWYMTYPYSTTQCIISRPDGSLVEANDCFSKQDIFCEVSGNY
jgi:hypothetical protein